MCKLNRTLGLAGIAFACLCMAITSYGIDVNLPLEHSHWIWYPEMAPGAEAPSSTVYLRKTFTIADTTGLIAAPLAIQVDNTFDLYINGVKCYSASDNHYVFKLDVRRFLQQGKNVIAVMGINYNNAAGAVLVMGLVRGDTLSSTVVTDTTWRITKTLSAGWFGTEFTETEWISPLDEGLYGLAPWANEKNSETRLFSHDIALTAFLAPAALIGGATAAPQVRAIDSGFHADSFFVYAQVDSAATAIYRDSQFVRFSGWLDSSNVTFKNWTLPQGSFRTLCTLKAWAAPFNDRNTANDTIRKPLIVQHITFQESPKRFRLYCRGKDDSATAEVKGVVRNRGADSASLTLYKDGVLQNRSAIKLQYAGDTASFVLKARLHAEFSEYRMEFRMDTALLIKADSIVCGDAFFADGQSNTHQSNQWFESPWMRTFGTDTLWTIPNRSPWGIGRHIVENIKIPVAILEGGADASPIDMHQRDTTLNSIYGRLYWRITRAGLKNGLRGAFWHQGENNSRDTAYATKFYTMTSGWKMDYPGIEHIYLFQIRPGCGSPGLEIVREQQRRMPYGHPDISVMTTGNVPGHDGCHYSSAGYVSMGDRMYPLIARDLYGSTDTVNITAPDIQEAQFADLSRTRIVMKFDQPVMVPSDTLIRHAFALGSRRVRVDSIASDTSLRIVTIFLHSPADSSRLSYVLDTLNGALYENPWLYSTRNLGAFTFYRIPILDSGATTSAGQSEIKTETESMAIGPNPMNPSVLVRYTVAGEHKLSLVVYGIDGRKVRTLVDKTEKSGRYRVRWDGHDDAGGRVGSGVYVIRLSGNGFKLEQKAILLK